MWGPRFQVNAGLCIDAHMCLTIFQRLNGVKTPHLTVDNAPGEWEGCVQGLWGWWYVGHSHHASLAPLVRVDSNEGGKAGENSEVSGVQSGKRK